MISTALFLMACGYKVAMGNAVFSLKDIADYIAPPVEEDGAVHVIEKILEVNNTD
ncbi:MAG: HAD hydrolase family protein [Patescibacteria group bacterium]